MDQHSEMEFLLQAVDAINTSFKSFVVILTIAYIIMQQNRRPQSRLNPNRTCLPSANIGRQIEHIHRLTQISDQTCINHLRMCRDTFGRLCYLLEHLGGLQPTRHLPIAEQMAIFLSILAHHKKNRVVKHEFTRSGHTISRHFNSVLKCVLRLHTVLLVQPKPIEEDEQEVRWKFFKGCLGALDGTYIPVLVSLHDKPRYRNRKGFMSVNMLGVCDRNMNFTYCLVGWEGSAADGRVLRDVVTRPNGLRVPIGNYYLCDGGYTNGEGFLAPYRGVRYHLQEWQHASDPPRTPQEYFNLMHSRARNVIERTFGVIKARWGILRSHSFYPIKTQNHIILACCLLHNFIRTSATIDPIESDMPDLFPDPNFAPSSEPEYVDIVQSSNPWSILRDNLALEMWNNRGGHAAC